MAKGELAAVPPRSLRVNGYFEPCTQQVARQLLAAVVVSPAAVVLAVVQQTTSPRSAQPRRLSAGSSSPAASPPGPPPYEDFVQPTEPVLKARDREQHGSASELSGASSMDNSSGAAECATHQHPQTSIQGGTRTPRNEASGVL